tara:strand:+ start:5358 stop:5690 length:333 start_codon:yes stop_codon:yes gene_type:complete
MTYEEIIQRVLTMTEDERKQITRKIRHDLKQQCAVDFNDNQIVDYCLFYVAEVRDKIVHLGPMRETYSRANSLDKVLGKKPKTGGAEEIFKNVNEQIVKKQFSEAKRQKK